MTRGHKKAEAVGFDLKEKKNVMNLCKKLYRLYVLYDKA
jgi:hypothetical protein